MRGKFLLMTLLAAINTPSSVNADGGTVRFSEQRDGRRITVFTTPATLRAGPVDVSVLVQDADSGTPLLEVPILVSAYPMHAPSNRTAAPATTETATNKLMRAAQLNLSESGSWRFEVAVAGNQKDQVIGFDVEVAEAPPPWLSMTLWIGWPFLVVGAFAVHQWLVYRRQE